MLALVGIFLTGEGDTGCELERIGAQVGGQCRGLRFQQRPQRLGFRRKLVNGNSWQLRDVQRRHNLILAGSQFERASERSGLLAENPTQ